MTDLVGSSLWTALSAVRSSSAIGWTSVILFLVIEVVALAIYTFLMYVPMFLRILLRNNPGMHQDVISDIPGNVHAFDNAVISLFRTLPEPNNFNVVWTRVPLQDDLIISGILPPSRMNSLSVYNADKGDDVPNSMEVTTKECRFYLSKSVQKTDLEINRQWKYAMIVVRNYLVPPGTVVNTLEIRRAKDGKLIRASQALPAGAPVLHLRFDRIYRKLTWITLGHVLCWILNTILSYTLLGKNLFVKESLLELFFTQAVLTGFAVVIATGIYQLIFHLGKQRLATFFNGFLQNKRNEIKLCPLEKGAEGSQPSKLHSYYLVSYDVAAGQDLQITGKIDATRQQYWSLVAYDIYGLPLPSFVYDSNVNRIREDGNVYEYDIRLRHNKKGKQDQNDATSTAAATTETVIDVSNNPQGYILFRLVHPRDDQVQEFSYPKTQLVNHHVAVEGKAIKKKD